MPKKKFSPGKIVTLLRQIEVTMSQVRIKTRRFVNWPQWAARGNLILNKAVAPESWQLTPYGSD